MWTSRPCERLHTLKPDCSFCKAWMGILRKRKAVASIGLKVEYPKRKNSYGPGTELKQLIEMLGLTSTSKCQCESRAQLMNDWGVEGCRNNREGILNWLRKEQKKRSWIEILNAVSLAVTSGLAFKLNPLDPAPGLLDEAIRRAEAKINNAQEHKPPENSAAGAAEGDHV